MAVRQQAAAAAPSTQRREPGQALVKGGELVELLRLTREQQSKQALISVQLQEVSGCESVCGRALAPAV